MAIEEGPIFKFVSFRAALEGLVIDGSEDHPDDDVVVLIGRSPDDVETLRRRVREHLQQRDRVAPQDVGETEVGALASALPSLGAPSFESLAAFRHRRDGRSLGLREIGAGEAFVKSYNTVFASWLFEVLSDGDRHAAAYEPALRAGHLGLRMARRPDSLTEAGVVANLLRARIVLPKGLLPAGRRRARLERTQRERLRSLEVRTGAAAGAIEARRAEYRAAEQRIETREALQRKANDVYWSWRRETSAAGEAPRVVHSRSGGLVRRVSEYLFGTPVASAAARSAARPTELGDGFFRRLDARLRPAERTELDRAVTEAGGVRAATLKLLLSDYLDTTRAVRDANDACAAIRVWERDQTSSLPPAPDRTVTSERPSVRAIGWGDLIVARERLVGYDAREIAHIENVLAGEKRLREHERTQKRKEVVETETVSETESERDLQTTDRYELRSESQETINQEFSVEAGVNTSGRYGLTKIETSLDVGFQRSGSEARSSSVQLAKEIVSRAVDRVFESVRERRQVTLSEQIREFNRHAIKNVAVGGGPTPTATSGVYLWVEKVEEVELRHYGTRLMVEFHIPEPGVSLLDLGEAREARARKPAEFKLGPADVKSSNYLCLTRLFGAQDVEPPPPQFVDVGYSWNSTPDEDTGGNKAEDTVADVITIPEGYKPVSGLAHVTSIPWGDPGQVFLYLVVGGQEVVDGTGVDQEGEFVFDPADTWPDGVPVSLAAHGHFDKTLVAQVMLRCTRTEHAMAQWRLRTWERIRQAHQVLVQDYQRAVEEAELAAQSFVPRAARPAAVNREIERDELKKWSIKTLRVDPFAFDAVDQVGDHQEVDPLDSDLQAPIVRFFEEALEWRQMSYFLYPYFWGRRDAFRMRQLLTDPDSRHATFLKAGAVRVIVPVTPGYEDRVLRYLDSDPADDELDRIRPLEGEGVPSDSEVSDLWLELLVHRNDQLALGSGTLSVTQGSASVSINDDSTWSASERDVGRELYIAGDRYVVASVSGEQSFEIEPPYAGHDDSQARYATGTLPFGTPWLVRIPTSLVILAEQRAKLALD
jgi:hypothetical protein